MQSKQDLDKANEEVAEVSRELDHWTSEAAKSRAFYESHGCTYQGEAMWRCPAGTPDYPLREYTQGS